MNEDARHAAERVARASYGRLLAAIAARTRDIGAAEDALATAFRTALERWPADGVPRNPEGWLVTAARRAAGHDDRHAGVRARATEALLLLADERHDSATTLPDERLNLLFVCAHPAIDPATRTPLMLQTVLGLDAARIAAAFVTAPATMAQRLVRAKTKIRDAGIRFEPPDPERLSERLADVLAAVYAAYGSAWDDGLGTDLAEEALFLARLIVDLLPEEPEARGLLALMLYCESRSAARRDADSAYVPLNAQDVSRWSRPMIEEAERHLIEASRHLMFGRFQTEAAIQSVHAQRAVTGTTNHEALAALYDLLAGRAPSLGALVGRAAAHGQATSAGAGLRLLDQIDPALVSTYQPYWATRAHLLRAGGDPASAAVAADRAIGLSEDPAVRRHLGKIFGR